MGHGIAQASAMNGYEVSLIDIKDELLKKAKQKIGDSLNRLSDKGKIKEDPETILRRITTTDNLTNGVGDADFIIEAIPEQIELKKKIWAEVDSVAPDHSIMATNTSGLSISAISEATKRREKLIGTHWFNPPQLMKLIEIVRSRYTDDETLENTIRLCRNLGKETIIAQRDVWFFLVVRALSGWSLEATLMYLRKEADVKAIDAMARYRFGLPMGPFELIDYTGIMEIKPAGLQSAEEIIKVNPEFEPWPAFLAANRYQVQELYVPMVRKGMTGVKTGKGFYTYPEGKYVKPELTAELAGNMDPAQLLAPAINVAARCVSDGIGSAEDINKACRLAYGWPKGIFEFVEEIGVDRLIDILKTKMGKAPEQLKSYYEPDPLLSAWKVS